MKHVREDLPDVQRLRPELSAATAAVLDRATAKDLELRYPHAEGMIAAPRGGPRDRGLTDRTGDRRGDERVAHAPRRCAAPSSAAAAPPGALGVVTGRCSRLIAPRIVLAVAAARTHRGTGRHRRSSRPRADPGPARPDLRARLQPVRNGAGKSRRDTEPRRRRTEQLVEHRGILRRHAEEARRCRPGTVRRRRAGACSRARSSSRRLRRALRRRSTSPTGSTCRFPMATRCRSPLAAGRGRSGSSADVTNGERIHLNLAGQRVPLLPAVDHGAAAEHASRLDQRLTLFR